MSNRITHSMLQRNVLADLNAVSTRLSRTQTKIASNKEISRPSDDPFHASQAMAFTYLMPVFTAFFAAIFLDETISLETVVCGAAIVFGLWLVNQSRSKPGASVSRGQDRGGEAPPPPPPPTPAPTAAE